MLGRGNLAPTLGCTQMMDWVEQGYERCEPRQCRTNIRSAENYSSKKCDNCSWIKLHPHEYEIRYNPDAIHLKFSRNQSISFTKVMSIENISEGLFVCDVISTNETDEEDAVKRSITKADEMALAIITIIGMTISIIALTILISLYSAIAKFRNRSGKCVLSLSVWLLCAYILYLLRIIPAISGDIKMCVAVALLTQLTHLSTFFWLNVLAFDYWRGLTEMSPPLISRKGSINNRFLHYSIYALVTPLFLVCFAILSMITTGPEQVFHLELCLLKGGYHVAYFLVPVAAVLTSNLVFFILTSMHIHQVTNLTAEKFKTKKCVCLQMYLYFKLSIILGFTWLFGFIAAASDILIFHYIYVSLNSVVGLLLALIFLCSARARKHLSESIHDSSGESRVDPSRFKKRLKHKNIKIEPTKGRKAAKHDVDNNNGREVEVVEDGKDNIELKTVGKSAFNDVAGEGEGHDNTVDTDKENSL